MTSLSPYQIVRGCRAAVPASPYPPQAPADNSPPPPLPVSVPSAPAVKVPHLRNLYRQYDRIYRSSASPASSSHLPL